MSPRIPTLALVIAAAVLAGCGGSGPGGDTAGNSTTPSPTTSRDGSTEGAYPPLARDAFLDSCEGTSTPETCECTLRYLEENISVEEFVEVGIAVSSGEPTPAVLTKAEESCK